MSSEPENPLAFPSHGLLHRNGQALPYVSCQGMTLLDFFAAHAPISLRDAQRSLPRDGCIEVTHADLFRRLAQMRYAYADAMLRARSKP